MAAAPSQLNSNLFGGETADIAEVERLETQPPQQPQAEPAPEQPSQPEAPHEETVSYGRFKEVNDAKNALEQELTQAREWRARLDERQRLIKEQADWQAQQEAAQRKVQERPDPALDPFGAELYDLKQARLQDRQTIDQLQGQLNQFGQNYQTGQEQAAFAGWVSQEANNYAAQDANYFPAAKYLSDRRTNFWKSVAPNAPAGLAEKLVEGESILIARLAQQYGGKFAPALVQLARDWGFGTQANGNGPAARRPSPAQPASPRNAQLQQVANGQRLQGMSGIPSASSNNGQSAYRNYSAADVANMSEREFMQAMANPASARDLRYAMSKAEGIPEDSNW